MLTRRQLEDAVRCLDLDCRKCAMDDYRGYCLQTTAKTALAYRNMLHHVIDGVDYCPVCGQDKPGHKPDCELAALLKESEVEHDA